MPKLTLPSTAMPVCMTWWWNIYCNPLNRNWAMAETLRVELGERSYDILVGERLLAKAGTYIASLLKRKQVIIITDDQVARFYLHRLTNALEEQGVGYRCVIVKSGESTKSFESFGQLMENILEFKPDRNTTLVALGGGVVGDITGFA